MDLNYKNKEGITLQSVLDTISKHNKLSKKQIIKNVSATKSIDTLLKKLADADLITKVTEGRSVFFTLVITPTIDKPMKKVSKAKPKKTIKKKTDIINELTKPISENHQITKVIEVTSNGDESEEINQSDLDLLKTEMEGRTGKEVTAILHHRNESKPKKEKQEIEAIYNMVKEEENEINIENPYRFVLNFFTTTLNGEIATGYFRRRDNYVVKSIYNKFKTLCEIIDMYDTNAQHQPFYRSITINEEDLTVKIYHIDMNRMIRGSYTLFKISEEDKELLFEKGIL